MRFAKTRLHIVFLTSLLLAVAAATFLNYRNFEHKRDAYYTRLQDELNTAYDLTAFANQETARIAFDTFINQPEILEFYRQANSPDEDVRNATRRQLLEKFGPLYERLKLRGVRQLQFHLPNSESFLRFLRPEKYGDSLKGVRYSVAKANTELVAVCGFEQGRIINGFRNVFPLIYNDEHLGSVEITMGFDAIRRRMERQFHNRYAFMVRRRLVEDRVFADEQGNYQPGDLSDEYLYERNYTADDTLRAINAVLKPKIQERLGTGEAFVVDAGGHDAARLVAFFPVKDVQGQQAAYIVSYNDDATISGYYSEFTITLAISIASILAIIVLLYLLTDTLRRLRAEKVTLQQEQEQFRRFMNASPSLTFIKDASFRYLFADKLTADFFGKSIDAILGKTDREIAGEEKIGPCPSSDKKALESDTVITVEEKLGGRIYEVIKFPLTLPGGEKGIGGIMNDITDRRQAEEALRISEERLNLALNGAELGLWDWHIPSGKVVINEHWAQMLGYAPEEIEPNVRSWEKLIHPDDMETVMACLTDHLEGHSAVYQTEYRLRAKSGEWKWILDTGKVLERDKDGKPVRMLGLHQDITERRLAEEKLIESEDRLSKTMIAANDGMWDWNLTNNEVYFDPRYYEMADYDVDEFPHRLEEFQKRIHPEDFDYVMNEAQKHLEGKIDRFIVEFRFKKKHGEWMWIMGKGIIVERDYQLNPIRFIGTHTDITERKQAEEQLHNEREKLFVTLRSIGDGVITTDTDGRVSFINNVAEQLTGWSRQEAAGQTLSKVFHIINEKTGEPVENPVNMVLDSGKIIGLANHTTLIAGDGTRRSIADSGAPILDAEGKLIGVVLVFRDVTEKKIQEEALKEKERFLQTIFDGIQDPMHVIDRDYRVLLTNKKLLEMKNVKQEEIRGKYCYEAYHERNELCEQCGAKEVFKTGKPYSLMKKLPLPDGTYGYFEVYSFPLFGESGEVHQVIELTQDVTIREKAMREMHKMTRIVEQAAEVVAVTDTEGKIEYVNATFENITGYSLNEVKGKNPRILKSDSQPPEVYKELWETITKGDIWRGQFINKKKKGPEYYEEAVIFPMKNEDGKIINYVKIARDITKEKEAEENLRTSLAEKEVLLKEVHHRVKNNLTIVSSLLNLQAATIQSQEQALAALQHSRDRIMAMAFVHEDLYKSRDYANVDMSRYLRELVDNLSLVYSANERIRVVVEASGVTLSLNASIPCGLILNEIITNAFKYAFPEGRKGTVRVTLSGPTEGRVLMEVSDDGVGLPRPFAESSDAERSSLGLSLVRILVEQLGGTVEVTTAQGTAYRIEFPYAVEP